GMHKRAETGKWNGGIILGYDVQDKKLIINEQESLIIKRIFELRANMNGYKAIANQLNKSGYKTKKGNLFSINSIKTIVMNDVYVGKVRWNKYQEWSTKKRTGKTDPLVVDGEHEAIITQELWDEVQRV